LSLFVLSISQSHLPGEATISSSDFPQAEPHDLESAMNAPASPLPLAKALTPYINDADGCADNELMKVAPKRVLIESIESQENGNSNSKFLEKRRKENEQLPDHLKHKTLEEIWRKETPCECPFNRWKPVCGVDGNTYPTECFAKCGDIEIFIHADCKYVTAELWKRLGDKVNQGRIPTTYTDDMVDNELCVEGDDDGNDPRPKCPRKLPGESSQPTPFLEGEEPPATPLRGMVTSAIQKKEPVAEIEYRILNGMKVPYYTGEVSNPCPECPVGYAPVCGKDAKTYPSGCFAKCSGAEVEREGECGGNSD